MTEERSEEIRKESELSEQIYAVEVTDPEVLARIAKREAEMPIEEVSSIDSDSPGMPKGRYDN